MVLLLNYLAKLLFFGVIFAITLFENQIPVESVSLLNDKVFCPEPILE